MSSTVELSLFDFLDEYAEPLRSGSIDRRDTVQSDSGVLEFCESFFDQFFGSLGCTIKGVLATSAALRGSGVTIWLALLSFAFQQRLGALGWLAGIVAIVFLILDGYHGWLYREAAGHASRTERLISSYYDTLSRSEDDPGVLLRFRGQLRAHRTGLFTGFQSHFGVKQLWRACPSLIYKVLYPALAIIALASGTLLYFGVIGQASPPEPTRVIVEHSR